MLFVDKIFLFFYRSGCFILKKNVFLQTFLPPPPYKGIELKNNKLKY